MPKVKKFITNIGSVFADLAIMVGISTSNSACNILWHQPKEPETMNKFKF